MVVILFVFFCKQKTGDEMRISDWSPVVCSSDLRRTELRFFRHGGGIGRRWAGACLDPWRGALHFRRSRTCSGRRAERRPLRTRPKAEIAVGGGKPGQRRIAL